MINYKDYHPKWSLISHLVRAVRAKNCCERCGAVNGEPHPVTNSKVILTVAHLMQDRNFNRFWNLAALCQRCHLNYDRKMHMYSRRYGRNTRYVYGRLFTLPAPNSAFAKAYMTPAATIRLKQRRKTNSSNYKLLF